MINKKSDIKFDKIDEYEAEGLLSTLTREFWFFSCKKCGGMVILPDNENNSDPRRDSAGSNGRAVDTRNLRAHSAWHDMQTKVKQE